jgi:hypothetical protein
MWADVGISRTQLLLVLRHLSLDKRHVLPAMHER